MFRFKTAAVVSLVSLFSSFTPAGAEEFPIIDGFVHYPQTFSFYRDQKPEALAAVIAGISGTAQQ